MIFHGKNIFLVVINLVNVVEVHIFHPTWNCISKTASCILGLTRGSFSNRGNVFNNRGQNSPENFNSSHQACNTDKISNPSRPILENRGLFCINKFFINAIFFQQILLDFAILVEISIILKQQLETLIIQACSFPLSF